MARKTHPSNPDDNPAFSFLLWAAMQYHRLSGKRHRYAPKQHQIKTNDYQGVTVQEKATLIMRDVNSLLSTTNKDPIPSSPVRPPVVCIRMRRLPATFSIGSFGHSFHASTASIGGARRIVDMAIGDRSYKWRDNNTIVINNLVEVTTDVPDALETIMLHQLTPTEINFHLPERYRAIHQLFRDNDVPLDNTPTMDEVTPKANTPKLKDLVDLAEILIDTDITPSEARNALRKNSINKPTSGRWAWAPDQVPDVLKQITNLVARQRKK